MPPQKYFTEEERKAARRERDKQHYEEHKEEMREKQRQYRAERAEHYRELLEAARQARPEIYIGRNRKNNYHEQLSEADMVSNMDSASTYLVDEMNKLGRTEAYTEFVELLKSKGIENPDDIEAIHKASQRAFIANNRQRGAGFEKVVLKMLLNLLNGTNLKVYTQVPTNERKCRIDFVITEQTEFKDRLDLSKAVVVSTKTSLSSSTWREDMHLYDKCKRYFMLTMDVRMISEALPSNVYFASPNYTTESEHAINLDSMKDLIIKAFEETTS